MKDAFELAGTCGIEPWRYSLRELDWMARARRRNDASGVARICWFMLRLWSKAEVGEEDLLPVDLRPRKAEKSAGERKAEFRKAIAEVARLTRAKPKG